MSAQPDRSHQRAAGAGSAGILVGARSSAKIAAAVHMRTVANRATLGDNTYMFVDDNFKVYAVPAGGFVCERLLRGKRYELLAVLDPSRPEYSRSLVEKLLLCEVDTGG